MALVWGAVCLLCAAGVGFAALDAKDPSAAAGDASAGSLPPQRRLPDDTLFKPGMVRAAPVAKRTGKPVAPPLTSAERCLRDGEADALIHRLLTKIRKEQAERRSAREAAKQKARR